MFQAVFAHETGKGVNRGEPLVAGRSRAVPGSLEVSQKLADKIDREIQDGQSIDGPVKFAGGERQEQAERVAIAELRIACEVAARKPDAPAENVGSRVRAARRQS